MKRIAALWRELKQRGVVGAIVVYAVVGFVVLLLADLLANALSIPIWLHRLLIRTALAGLPITALVAWSFDLRRDIRPVGGRDLDVIEQEERSHRTSLFKVAGTVVSVLALSLLVGAVFTSRENAPAVVEDRVVIAPFENRTDNRELEGLGTAAADWVAQRLIETRQFDVVPFSVATAYTAIVPPKTTTPIYARALDLARGVGAGLVVWGSYYLDHDSLKFAAQLMDSRSGNLVHNIRTTSAPAYQMSDIVARFQENVAHAIARHVDKRLTISRYTIVPPAAARAQAHESYVAGLQRYAVGDYAAAAALFREAAARDSSFANAGIWEARALADVGNCAAADTLAQALDRFKPMLPGYERAMLERVQAQSRHDTDARYDASTAMLRLAPGSDDAIRLLASDALAVSHPREARSTLLTARPEHGWLLGWGGGYFATLALAYDQILDYRGELRVAREGVRRFPASAESWLGICRAQAGLHHISEVEAEAANLQTRFDYTNAMTPGTAFFYCAQEMASHGEADAVRFFVGRSFAWFKAHADRKLTPSTRADFANVLALLHHNDDAYRVMSAIAQEPLLPEEAARMRARLGFIAAITGRTAEAHRIDRDLDTLPTAVLTHYVEYEQARIAAVLGDRDRAWNKLVQALQDGFPFAEINGVGLSADYALAPLRKEPRFRFLLRPGG